MCREAASRTAAVSPDPFEHGAGKPQRNCAMAADSTSGARAPLTAGAGFRAPSTPSRRPPGVGRQKTLPRAAGALNCPPPRPLLSSLWSLLLPSSRGRRAGGTRLRGSREPSPQPLRRPCSGAALDSAGEMDRDVSGRSLCGRSLFLRRCGFASVVDPHAIPGDAGVGRPGHGLGESALSEAEGTCAASTGAMTLLVTVTERRFGCALVLVSGEPRGSPLEYYQS